MGAQMATDPISLQQLRNASEDAQDLEHYVNDDVPALIQTRLGGKKPNYVKFLAERNEEFQQFLLSSGYQDLGDYAAGIAITGRNQVFRRDGELWRASASLDLPYTTTGVWADEGDSFVAVGDAVLRQDLTQVAGTEMIGHEYSDPGRPTVLAAELRELRDFANTDPLPAVQDIPYYITAMRDASDYSILANGATSDRYLHSPRIVVDVQGRYHQVHSRGLMHGYGGLVPPAAVSPQGEIIYSFSDDKGRTWSPEQVICVALPDDEPGMFRTVFDCIIGVCPSGRLAVGVTDIVPPSAQWGVDTGQTKYRWLINDTRGELNGDGSIAWVDKGVFFTAFNDYARLYAERIKMVPKAGGGWRMMFTDYRKVEGGGDLLVRSYWVSDDEFETAPVEFSQIASLENSSNETDVAFVDADLGYAIARGGGEMHVTRDAGATWQLVGNSSNYSRQLWEAGGLVAPVIDFVWKGGKPYLFLAYSHRGAGPDGPRFAVASLTDLQAFENAVALGQLFTPWGIPYLVGPNVSGPGGYNSALLFESGATVYVDCTETTVSPITGFMRSDVRIVRTNAGPLFPTQGGLMLGTNVSRLNEYRNNEIPFVPRLEGATAAGTPTYSSAAGYNVRIGHMAFVDAEMIVTAYTGITGDLLIRGLPFAPLNVGFNPASIRVEVIGALAGGFAASDRVVALLLPTTNQIRLYKKANTGGLVALTLADLGAAFNVRISGNYYCANEGLS
jgi:hypothetical protein